MTCPGTDAWYPGALKTVSQGCRGPMEKRLGRRSPSMPSLGAGQALLCKGMDFCTAKEAGFGRSDAGRQLPPPGPGVPQRQQSPCPSSVPSRVSLARASGQKHPMCHRELLCHGVPRLPGSCGSPAAPAGPAGWRHLQRSRSQLDPSGQGVCPSMAGMRPGKRTPAPLQGVQCRG